MSCGWSVKRRACVAAGAVAAVILTVGAAEFPLEGCPDQAAATVDNPMPILAAYADDRMWPGDESGRPIVFAGGKLVIPVVDAVVTGEARGVRATEFKFSRFYCQQDGAAGVLGVGWSTVLDMRVREIYDEVEGRCVSILLLKEEAGNLIFLRERPSRSKVLKPVVTAWTGEGYTAQRTPDGSVRIRRPNGDLLVFGGNGQPATMKLDGATWAFRFADGTVAAVECEFETALTFAYQPDGRLQVVHDSNGHTLASYSFDDSRRLSAVRRADASAMTYRYEDPVDPTNITAILGPGAAVAGAQYSHDGGGERVASIYTSTSGRAELDHNRWLGASVVSRDGGERWAYVFRSGGGTERVVEPKGSETTLYASSPVE